MNDAEVKRLAHAINELRPTWPISSLTTFIGKNMSNRVYRDAAVALVFVALDVDAAGQYVTQTPKRVLESGPWWKAAELNGSAAVRPRGPKRNEACRDCGGFKGSCPCTHESRAVPDDDLPPPVTTPGLAGAALVRAQMQAAMNPTSQEEA